MDADYIQHGDIAVITVRHPPASALSAQPQTSIRGGLARAEADPGIIGTVITGTVTTGTVTTGTVITGNSTFIAEVELGDPAAYPSLRELFAAIEAAGKPVVAAIAGSALGVGLELALACHYRIVTADARLGFPGIDLGLVPGGGGTVRLPRLAGLAAALDIMLTGKPVSAQRALALGVVDRVVDFNLLAAAIDFARSHTALPLPVTRTRSAPPADPVLLDHRRAASAARWRGLTAPGKILECMAAATTQTFDEACKFEEQAFLACLQSPERPALVHASCAEREAARIPGIGPDVTARLIRRVGVVGAGTMGGGIAMSFANAGVPVTLVDVSTEALARGWRAVEKNYATSVARGSMDAAARDSALALIGTATDYEALAACDIVIEAAFEAMDVKRAIFARLDAIMPPGAILATNTSTLDIDAIAAATRRSRDVVGTHFFSPANVMKLQENVRGAATSPDVIVTVMALAKRIGKIAVLAGNCDGFIGNRVLAVYGREADFLLEEGATPWQIDEALMEFGFPMGIYRMRDLSGLDVGWRIRQYREATRDPSTRYSPIADRLCEQGRFGQKTGAGYYRYDGRTPTPDPDVQALAEQVAAERGITRHAIADAEIVTRILTAMVNEAAKILGEGIAQRASDIDVVYLAGYGFPRHQGGPMFWGAQRGLDRVLADVRRYHAAHGALWTPAPLLVENEAAARSFPT